MNKKKSRLAEAFGENFNIVGLAGAAALSAALLNPIPLLIGVVAEAAYLLFVPDSKWYDARLSVRFDAEVAERRRKLKEKIFPTISKQMQGRYERLNFIRGEITAQPGMENENWFREVLRKLDYLLEKFLLFASKEAEFRAYLQNGLSEVHAGRPSRRMEQPPPDFDLFDEPRQRRGRRGGNERGRGRDREDDSPPAFTPTDMSASLADRWVGETVRTIQEHYDREIAQVNTLRETEEDLNTKAILEKRADVLEQRKEHVGRIGKILANLGHQMELLEDSFGLINDQLRARSPEQVLADIEGVVFQTDSMTRLLEELAPYEQMAQRLGV